MRDRLSAPPAQPDLYPGGSYAGATGGGRLTEPGMILLQHSPKGTCRADKTPPDRALATRRTSAAIVAAQAVSGRGSVSGIGTACGSGSRARRDARIPQITFPTITSTETRKMALAITLT